MERARCERRVSHRGVLVRREGRAEPETLAIRLHPCGYEAEGACTWLQDPYVGAVPIEYTLAPQRFEPQRENVVGGICTGRVGDSRAPRKAEPMRKQRRGGG